MELIFEIRFEYGEIVEFSFFFFLFSYPFFEFRSQSDYRRVFSTRDGAFFILTRR